MDASQLSDALALAESAASVRAAAALLRQHFAPLQVVVVDAFDMRDEQAAARGATRALYFGASDGHCWRITSDPAQAVGLFVSEAA
jgi:hypothetical protein